ncbi:hypothetical protein ACO9S2_10835 [Nitrospira sp. NS4]|uniref:hypothetical protein n=1 Tax=Nitrospira sp. NS4 TaxID=3414498 RepID=UPI003C2B2A0B
MTDTKTHSGSIGSGPLQGRRFSPQSFNETVEAIELAFDYRGDVTVGLKSGEQVGGYLYNRELKGADSSFDLFPADSAESRRIRYDEVAMVAFSGEDTASGKSWENWVAKKESERKAEADRVAADAKARGYL